LKVTHYWKIRQGDDAFRKDTRSTCTSNILYWSLLARLL